MKKILALLILALSCTLLFSSCAIIEDVIGEMKEEQEFKNEYGLEIVTDKIHYIDENGQSRYRVSGYISGIGSCTDKKIVVPHGLYAIGDKAFKDCDTVEETWSAMNINLPEGVTLHFNYNK